MVEIGVLANNAEIDERAAKIVGARASIGGFSVLSTPATDTLLNRQLAYAPVSG